MIKEEAIEILSDIRAEYNIFSDDEEEATRYHALSWAIQALNERTGRWIDTDTTWSAITDNATIQIPAKICSKCGKPIPQIMWKNYCPNCGAEMEVGE